MPLHTTTRLEERAADIARRHANEVRRQTQGLNADQETYLRVYQQVLKEFQPDESGVVQILK